MKILHILSPDKFTIPFIHLVNKEFNPEDHVFLCCSKPDKNLLSSADNIFYLNNPYRRNIFRNTLLFYRKISEASKIILHGNRLNFYFFIFSKALKKTYWGIMGFEFSGESNTEDRGISGFLKRFVLKRVYGHITHIIEDSEYANTYYKSSARVFYTNSYQSNVVEKRPEKLSHNGYNVGIKSILVGNSTSPTNNHASIFKMLLPFKDDDIIIYCPLSYGKYNDYRDSVIKMGKELFKDKFIPLTELMKLEDYLLFLEKIDIAIFNHKRQEAMGVTIQLLNLGKVIYMNKDTTSYRSFIRMGIKVFDNSLIGRDGLFAERDIHQNPEIVYSYYSYDNLIKTWSQIFKD